jgi:hypothetical protein
MLDRSCNPRQGAPWPLRLLCFLVLAAGTTLYLLMHLYDARPAPIQPHRSGGSTALLPTGDSASPSPGQPPVERSAVQVGANLLQVFVLDELSGSPVVGASVAIQPIAPEGPEPGDGYEELPSSLRKVSGPDGAAVFEQMVAGRYRIALDDLFLVLTDGATAEVIDRSSGPQIHKVTACFGGGVRGRVIDETGAPVVGARVVALVGKGNPFQEVREPMHPRALSGESARRCDTDADGWFELRGCPPRLDSRMQVTHRGYAPVVAPFVVGEPYTITYLSPVVLTAGASLRVVVLASDTSEPVADALVLVDPVRGADWRRTARSAAKGIADLGALPSGRCRITVVVAGFSVTESETDVRVDASNEVVMKLASGVSVGGVVVDAANAPVVGAKIDLKVKPVGSKVRRSFGKLRGAYAQTDREGRFQIEGLPSQSMVLSAWHQGHASVFGLRCDVPCPPIRVVLPGQQELRGVVRSGDGTPVVEFQLHWKPEGAPTWLGPRTIRHPSGQFRIPGVLAPALVLATTGACYGTDVLSPQPATDSDEVESVIILRSKPSIQGLVIDERTRQPIQGATVTCASGGDAQSPAATIVGTLLGGAELAVSCRSGLDGWFELQPVMIGKARIRVAAAGYVSMERSIEVDRATRQIESLSLQAVRQVRGIALLPDGTAIRGAKVFAFREDASVPVASAMTDETGAFTISLGSGSHRLWSGGFSPVFGLWQLSADVRDGGDLATLSIRVEQPSSALLGVVVRNGQPVAGARIRAILVAESSVTPLLWPSTNVVTDGRGGFRFDQLGAGTYHLLVSDGDYSATGDVQIAAGRTETMRFDIR